MSDKTAIEWTDASANVINGCSLASPGCTNCYAMRLAGTRMRNHPTRAGLAVDSKAGPVWTGEVRFHEPALQQVLRWQRPRMIFWNAHGDIFHPNVPDAWIDRCFAAMALTPQHIHQVLTKRSERMREYMSRACGRIMDAIIKMRRERGDLSPVALPHVPIGDVWWPLPNVWLGVSTEDQQRADERIPDLLATPAAVRWISAEPLLGPIDLTNITGAEKSREYGSPVHGWSSIWRNNGVGRPWIDWVVVGGESGPHARPMHPDWARSLRDQCAAASVPFFHNQNGEWRPSYGAPAGTTGHYAMMARDPDGWTYKHPVLLDHYPRQFDAFGSIVLERVGKRAAGRLLDGVGHNGFPEVRS